MMFDLLGFDAFQVNQPASFTIQLNGAQGKLDARVVAPSGAEDEAIIQNIDQGASYYNSHQKEIYYNLE